MKIRFQKQLNTSFVLPFLVYLGVFGHLIRIPGIRVLGVAITAYRLFVPLILLGLICKKRDSLFIMPRYTARLMLFFLFWVIWSFSSALISPYSSFRLGIKEALIQLFGFLYIFELMWFTDEDSFPTALRALHISLCLLCIFALFEIFTGFHLSTSKLANPKGTELSAITLIKSKNHMAFACFFNENDFCTFLAIFAPILFCLKQSDTTFQKCCRWFFFLLICFILLRDDANIATVALILGLFTFLLVQKAFSKKVLLIFFLLIPLLLGGAYFVLDRLGNTLAVQIANSQAGAGSFFHRSAMFRDCIRLLFDTNGLGVGAGGFMNYFKQTAHESNLVNPHNWWLELLTTYGVFVFIPYVFMILDLLVGLFYKARRHASPVVTGVFSILICFMLACIAPSTFLGNTYHWIIIWLSFSALYSIPPDLSKQDLI